MACPPPYRSTRAAPLRRSASVGALPRSHARTRWWVEALTIAWLCWVYDAITNLAPLRLHAALTHAQGILRLEQSLHLDPELTLDRWLAGHHTLGLLVSDYYDNAHFVVTLGLLGWLWWRREDIYRPLRNSLVLVNVLAFVVFWRYPGGPAAHAPGLHRRGRLHARIRLLAHRCAGLAGQSARGDALAAHRLGGVVHARALADLDARDGCVRSPSLYPCVTALAVLATGNHYVLDIVGGLVAIAASLRSCGWPRAGRAG